MKYHRILFISGAGVAVVVTILLFSDFRSQITQSLATEQEHYFNIQAGNSLRQILLDMHEAGLINKADSIVPLSWYVMLYAWLNSLPQYLQAGEYQIEPAMTLETFLDNALTGKVIQRKLRIIEGFTFRQIIQAMKEQTYINLLSERPVEVCKQLGIQYTSPEGWIFPDTYLYSSGTNSTELFKRGYQAMQQALHDSWVNRSFDVKLKTPYEALILASIVEKETAQADERPLIAGVFLSRLEKGMLLQADSTIIYGLGESFDGDIKARDLVADNPYNSYLYKGLPPTPIAMPGLSSIKAVMHPEMSNYLYFVSKGDGTHHFSATYKEHLSAVRKYQLSR